MKRVKATIVDADGTTLLRNHVVWLKERSGFKGSWNGEFTGDGFTEGDSHAISLNDGQRGQIIIESVERSTIVPHAHVVFVGTGPLK